MNLIPEHLERMAIEIADFEEQLQNIERQIQDIGQPAAQDLQRRLDALKIEERALNRNLSEVVGMADAGNERFIKAQALLAHILQEESSLAHATRFLHQAAPSSTELAAKAATQLFRLCHYAFKRIGAHHPLGMSAFVNHSEKNLEQLYGFDPQADKK